METHHAAMAGMFGVMMLIPMVIGIVVAVFYCLTMQKALERCAPSNRAMVPGMVWLLFIPLFNIVWQFFVVLNVSKSLIAEFKQRNLAGDPSSTKTIGLVGCIAGCCCVIPLVNFIAGPAALVCFIIFWVKVADFSGKIAVSQPTAP